MKSGMIRFVLTSTVTLAATTSFASPARAIYDLAQKLQACGWQKNAASCSNIEFDAVLGANRQVAIEAADQAMAPTKAKLQGGVRRIDAAIALGTDYASRVVRSDSKALALAFVRSMNDYRSALLAAAGPVKDSDGKSIVDALATIGTQAATAKNLSADLQMNVLISLIGESKVPMDFIQNTMAGSKMPFDADYEIDSYIVENTSYLFFAPMAQQHSTHLQLTDQQLLVSTSTCDGASLSDFKLPLSAKTLAVVFGGRTAADAPMSATCTSKTGFIAQHTNPKASFNPQTKNIDMLITEVSHGCSDYFNVFGHCYSPSYPEGAPVIQQIRSAYGL